MNLLNFANNHPIITFLIIICSIAIISDFITEIIKQLKK